VPALRNAFKYRLADRQSLDTGLFLHLYCPMLLDQLTADDFTISKLLVLRGSPGSGKSSFLRLFQTESLATLYWSCLVAKGLPIARGLFVSTGRKAIRVVRR